MRPADEKQLAEAVRSATSPFEIVGTGTKRSLGRPVEAQKLDLSRFNKVTAYEPEELILEAGAATKLSEIEKLLGRKQQMLAFEPPDYSTLLGSDHAGSLGGVLACNLSGPRRMKAGAARDHVLGISGVNGSGDVFKAGARVVKNVTGYDVPRLMAGSYGTLAALTSVIFKVLPKPETEITLHVKCKDVPQAIALMALALCSTAEVSSAAFIPKQGFYLRLEGIEASVLARLDILVRLYTIPYDVLPEQDSRSLWQSVRDVAPLWKYKSRYIWRVSVAPTDVPKMLASLVGVFDYFLDWAGGLIWIAAEPGMDVRGAVTSGHAILLRADKKTRQRDLVFHPQTPELSALSARVKYAFDPQGLFNPGRMYQDI